MPKLDATQLPDLFAQIGDLPARSTLTTAEAVVALRAPIEAALARGQTFESITTLLTRAGVRIQPSTLRWHLWRARKDQPTAAAEPHSETAVPSQRAHIGSAPTTAALAVPATPPAPAPRAAKEQPPAAPAPTDTPATSISTSSPSPATTLSTECDAPVLPRGHFKPKPDSTDI